MPIYRDIPTVPGPRPITMYLTNPAYSEIKKNLDEAGWGHRVARDGSIDMEGIVIRLTQVKKGIC